jgi:ferritin-like metal-binding protein YciE
MSNRETLIAWLRDAHAMEEAAARILDKLEDGFAHLPNLAVQFGHYRDESRAQAARIESCLKSLGADTSVVKDVVTRMLASAQIHVAAVTSDQDVKRYMAACTFTGFEVASYLALRAAAGVLEAQGIRHLCDQHLEHERVKARWLEDHMAVVTEEYMRP